MLIAVLYLFFRGPIGSGLTRFHGDSYDGLIEITILEHWYGVVARGDVWNVMGYFYPDADTLGYNDTNVVPGVAYVGARMAGGDPFVAALIAHMFMKALGFLGMYVLLRRGLGVRFWLAIGGAAVFATANASLLHMHHAQLLSVGLLPWLSFASLRTWRALGEGDRAGIGWWGGALAVVYGLVAFNAFYAAWFFGFFLLLFAPVGLAMMGRARRTALGSELRRGGPALAFVAALAVAALLPLAIVYLPKVAAGARHDWWSGAGRFLIGPIELINVGPGNLVWGELLGRGIQALLHEPLPAGEGRFGIPLGLLGLLTIAGFASLRKRRDTPLLAALTATLLITLVLMARWPGGFSLWRIVYIVVPGADAVRVVTRFLLFALVPIIVVVFGYLDRSGLRPAWLIVLVAFLLIEEVQLAAPLALDRPREMAMLSDVGVPPADCRSFAVLSARSGNDGSMVEARAISAMWSNEPAAMLRDNYRHNVDAMLIAVYSGKPTINGMSTFNPPDWALAAPFAADYLARVDAYAKRHKLTGLCLLDRRRAQAWTALP